MIAEHTKMLINADPRALEQIDSWDITTLQMPRPAEVNEAAVMHEIESTDLKLVKLKLTHPEYGKGWSQEQAEEGEKWYKMYLFLRAKYPDAKIIPTHLIDEFWHQHILDTRAYASDSQRIFGEFHHHYPYAGMLGDDDYREWTKNIRITMELFKQEFGVDYESSLNAISGCTCFGGKCKSE